MSDPSPVADLRVEGARGHVVTDLDHPWLSWVLPRPEPDGATVLVQARRVPGEDWEWSARVPPGGLGVAYAGPALAPYQGVQWRAGVLGEGGAVRWSEPGSFEAGLRTAGLVAEWVAAPSGVEGAPLLRCPVEVPAGVVRARLYACGLGSVRLSVDGAAVGQARLDPPLTDVRHTVLYSTVDLTAVLTPGRHVLGACLGRGFFAMTTATVWRWDQAPWRAEPCLVAQLVVDLADGGRRVLAATPGAWTCRAGPIVADSLYEGEVFDARQQVPRWDHPTGQDTGWSPVVRVSGPSGALLARDVEPVRVIEDVPARQVLPGRDGTRVFDYGRTTSGWVRVGAALREGQRLRLRHGEVLGEGSVVAENPHVHAERFQCDEVTGAGGPLDWEPWHSYKGFRYVQVEGLRPGQACTVRMQVAHSDVAPASVFSCDLPLFERYDAAMRRSLLSNLHGLPTDTPMYEKNGWTGDAQVAARVMATTLDLRRLLPKWLRDMAHAQAPDGRLPVIVPSPGWGYEDRIMAPEWTTAFPHLLREVYRCYGDDRTVARHWAAVHRYLTWELDRLQDGLAVTGLGDYLAPGTTGLPPEDRRLTATAYLHRALREGAELAGILGAQQQARALLGRAAALAERLNAVFLDPAEGQYRVWSGYRQSANAVPLALGLVPPEHQGAVARRLVEDVRDRDWHLDTGALGTQVLLPVLTRHGYAVDAHRVAAGTTYPGWGHWMAQGADTMWEFWQQPGRSRNHYFQGTVVQWLHEDVAGLRVGDHGWASFTVRPHARVGLTRAGLSLDTVRGRVATSWSQRAGRLAVDVEVPAGSRARVELPTGPGGAAVRAGLPQVEVVDGWTAYDAPPGRWAFEVDTG